MSWALSRKKPYFIGKPATEKRRAIGVTRRLCRFKLDRRGGADLGESCLVLRNGEPVGHVTSIATSETLNRVIGLAYAHPEDARAGSTIRLRDRAGRDVAASVVEHAFYDPDNIRQEA